MRRKDAPRPGWYPDPEGGQRLRWWDGLDWTDDRRAPPTAGLTGAVDIPSPAQDPNEREPPSRRGMPDVPTVRRSQVDHAEIMAEVRKVARDEVDRAAQMVGDRARDATRRLEPLISEYGDRALRWLRNAGIVVVVLVVLWMLLQTFAQATLMDWLGDRVDAIFGG